jgi:hypothetical protein
LSGQPSAQATLSSASAQDETASLPALIKPRLNAYDEQIVGPMIALARSSIRDRIMMAGTNSAEFLFELHRRGYCDHCKLPFCEWAMRRRFSRFKTTLDWLMDFLNPAGVMVIWVDPMQPSKDREIRSALERRGLIVEVGSAGEDGTAISARRGKTKARSWLS